MSEASKENGKDPAAPFVWTDRDGMETILYGMTKREAMAMHIFTGLLTRALTVGHGFSEAVEKCSKNACDAADALLEALE